MALSGTDDYSLSRDQIIRAAFENIGVAIANEPLEAEDVAVGALALNALSLSWKAHGLQLWKRGRYTISDTTTPALTASTNQYELGGTAGDFLIKPMRLIEVSRRTASDNNETDLNKLSLEEWEALPNKTTTGIPVSYYYEPQRLVGQLYLWPAPNATFASDYEIDIIYQAPIQDMDVGTEEVDYPNEWYRALIYALAVDLAPKYGLDRKERELLIVQANAALALAMSYDTEDVSSFFSPNNKGK